MNQSGVRLTLMNSFRLLFKKKTSNIYINKTKKQL
jgi:hypothetical protein